MPLDAISSIVLMCIFFCLVYGPWQAVCTDLARQRLFEKRDRVFDLALEGHFDFSSAEYRVIRSSFERSIRFAHTLTLPWFIVINARAKGVGKAKSDLNLAVDGIQDERARNEVRRLVSESGLDLILMMAAKSFFVMPIALLIYATVRLASAAGLSLFRFAGRNKLVQKLVDRIQSDAEACAP